MELKNSHGGYAGKSINERLRDMADEAYATWMNYEGDAADIHQGRVEGICEAMAFMTNTKADLQWESVEARYEDKKRRG